MTKIWVMVIFHNEEALAPWFVRHYGRFADRILAWDNYSTDNTRKILSAHPSVTVADWPGPAGHENGAYLYFAYDVYPQAIGKADWIMWVDFDEFIYAPDVKAVLAGLGKEIEIARTQGYQMLRMDGDGVPSAYGDMQIWERMPMGIVAREDSNLGSYSKPVVFRPEAKVRWGRGRHGLDGCNPTFTEKPVLKLLHYRYLGRQYTIDRNAKNTKRRLDNDPRCGWTMLPDYDGADAEHEGSPSWVDWVKPQAFNVIAAPLA